jgi:peroxidase
LPNVDNAKKICFTNRTDDVCYRAGDARVNQNPQLTLLHVLLMREHNRVAKELGHIHPEWDDETLYQEARTIVVAEMQHITYNEWLVEYIGEDFMVKHELFPLKSGYTVYNRGIPLIGINSFTAAAFRNGHSGIQGFLR